VVIKSANVLSKFVAINKEKGGPNTIQQEKAIKQSLITRTKTFFFLDRFIKKDEMYFMLIILL
tara:strand:- start:142 stop:330 length:189 start_codon:yes stop_codon:yes gene_type:complete